MRTLHPSQCAPGGQSSTEKVLSMEIMDIVHQFHGSRPLLIDDRSLLEPPPE